MERSGKTGYRLSPCAICGKHIEPGFGVLRPPAPGTRYCRECFKGARK